MISKLKIHLADFEREKSGETLLRLVMKKWCPISDCLLPIVVSHFPSPIAAQSYRFDSIYRGNDQNIIDAIKSGKENGKFVMVITDMLRSNEYGRRYAFGRILSGKLTKGDRVQVTTSEGTFLMKVEDRCLMA